MSEIEVPKLDWFERYKRMVGIAYAVIMQSDMQTHADFEGEEAASRIAAFHKSVSSECGEKLVKAYDLKPTVEDALKLFLLYSCEVWGYGSYEYVEAKLENENKGTFANLVCRGWELAKRMGKEDELRRLDCANGCTTEYTALLRALSDDLTLTMTKAFPRGDDRCEFTVEKL